MNIKKKLNAFILNIYIFSNIIQIFNVTVDKYFFYFLEKNNYEPNHLNSSVYTKRSLKNIQ